MAHVFISYSHNDSDFAELLKGKLEQAGFEAWLDEERLRAGEDWREEIDAALNNASCLILILSPTALNSQYVMYEWSFAWGAGKKVIPILLHKWDVSTQIHPRLDKRQYLDFSDRVSRNWEKLIKRLKELHNVPQPLSPADEQMVQAIASLRSWNRDERKKAADFLGRKKYTDAIPSLLETLHDEEFAVRISAVKALGKIGDDSTVLRLVSVLEQDETLEVRYEALKALRVINSPIPASVLVKALNEKDSSMRVTVAHTLLEIGHELDVNEITNLLHNEDELVRKTAAWILGGIKAKESVPYLIRALGDTDSSVRAHAAGALGDIGDSSAVSELIHLLKDDSAYTSLEGFKMSFAVSDIAFQALQKFKTPDALNALTQWQKIKPTEAILYNNVDQEDAD